MLKQGVPVYNHSLSAGNSHKDVYMTASRFSNKPAWRFFIFTAVLAFLPTFTSSRRNLPVRAHVADSSSAVVFQ